MSDQPATTSKTPVLQFNAANFVGGASNTTSGSAKPFGITPPVLSKSLTGGALGSATLGSMTGSQLVSSISSTTATSAFPKLQVKGIARVSLPNYASAQPPQFEGSLPTKPIAAPSLRLSTPQLKTQVPTGSLLGTRLLSRGNSTVGNGMTVLKEGDDHDIVQIGEHVAVKHKHGVVKAKSPNEHESAGNEITPDRTDKAHESVSPVREVGHPDHEPAGVPLKLEFEEPLEVKK